MSHQGDVSPPLAIVGGGRWTTNEPVDLVLKEKVFSLGGDGFTITDHAGNGVFSVKGSFMSMSERKTLKDMEGGAIATLGEAFISLHKTQKVFDPDGNLLFALKKKSMIQLLSSNMEVFLNDDNNQPDFEIKGNFHAKDFTVTHVATNQEVAKITRESFNARNFITGQDTYVVQVPTGGDVAFAILVAIAADEIYEDD